MWRGIRTDTRPRAQRAHSAPPARTAPAMTMATATAPPDSAATPQKGMQRILDRQVKCIVERIRTDSNRQLLVLDFLDGLDAQ